MKERELTLSVEGTRAWVHNCWLGETMTWLSSAGDSPKTTEEENGEAMWAFDTLMLFLNWYQRRLSLLLLLLFLYKEEANENWALEQWLWLWLSIPKYKRDPISFNLYWEKNGIKLINFRGRPRARQSVYYILYTINSQIRLSFLFNLSSNTYTTRLSSHVAPPD